MDKVNSKILTLSFAICGALVGLITHLMIKTFSGIFGVVARAADSDFVRHILPVLIGIIIFSILQFNKRVLVWGDEVASEVRKVVWPSQKDMTAMTLVVIIMVLISSVIVTGFDYVSGFIINQVLTR